MQQLDVRAEQAVFFVTQIATLKRQNTHDVATYSSRYTKFVFYAPLIYTSHRQYQQNSFFNTVWLIMNDMTLGVGFGTYLVENNRVLAELANHTIRVPSLLISPNSAKNGLS